MKKTSYCAIKRYECVNQYIKICENDCQREEWLPNRGDAHTNFFQGTNGRSAIMARINLRVIGKIRKRKNPPTMELNTFLLNVSFRQNIETFSETDFLVKNL